MSQFSQIIRDLPLRNVFNSNSYANEANLDVLEETLQSSFQVPDSPPSTTISSNNENFQRLLAFEITHLMALTAEQENQERRLQQILEETESMEKKFHEIKDELVPDFSLFPSHLNLHVYSSQQVNNLPGSQDLRISPLKEMKEMEVKEVKNTRRSTVAPPYNYLKSHVRIEAGQKHYVCSHAGCTVTVKDASNFRRHLTTHNGEKRFKCLTESCGKCYTRRSALKRHIHVVHNISEQSQ